MHGISLNFNEENLECIEPIVRGSVESSNSYDLYVSTDPVIDAESRYIYHVRRGGVLRRVKTDGTGNLTRKLDVKCNVEDNVRFLCECRIC